MKEIKLATVKQIVSNVFNVDTKSVNEKLSKDNLSSWDSVSQMTLIYSLEDYFEISITNEEALEITSFEAIIKLLTEKGINTI